jgi:CelD/BcsL family acetyltransferase involved in cellulose biosynthesis
MSLVRAALPIASDSPLRGPLTATLMTEGALWDLRREWGALLRSVDRPSMFLTWEWQEAWWRAFGRGDLWPVLVDGDRGPRAIVPLYRDAVRLRGIPLRTLRLVGDGSGDGDDLDALVADADGPGAAAALLRLLRHRRDWDLLQLHPVPESSRFGHAVERMARRAGWAMRIEHFGCTHTPLPDDWDDFLMQLKSRMRSRVRSLLRKLVDVEGSHLERIDRADRLDAALDCLFELHQARWQAIGKPGAFADPARRRMFRDFAFRALQHGWLRLFILHVDGAPMAAQLGYVYDNVFLQIQEGFDPDAYDRSPGVALRAAVFRECIGEGLDAYDNLLGTPPQKMRWGAVSRRVRRLTIARPGSLASVMLRAHGILRGNEPGTDGSDGEDDDD